MTSLLKDPTAQDLITYMRGTCRNPDGHTCEICFQGSGKGCEFILLADVIEQEMKTEKEKA